MNWIELNHVSQLDVIQDSSYTKAQVIFKHSTRCSISSMALNRLEKSEAPQAADFYFLDLIRHRDISNSIADVFNVQHESPQILIIKNGKCIYHESHLAIEMPSITENIA